jgi:hypothetical protein
MGLTAWKGDRILKTDTDIAKNYLGKIELEDLNRLVGMVLDFFEDQVQRGFLVSITDADEKLTEILKVNRRHMLQGAGRVSAKKAEKHAHQQYELFKEQRRFKEIFDLNKAAKSLPKSAAKSKSKSTKT